MMVLTGNDASDGGSVPSNYTKSNDHLDEYGLSFTLRYIHSQANYLGYSSMQKYLCRSSSMYKLRVVSFPPASAVEGMESVRSVCVCLLVSALPAETLTP